ncbi:MAG: zeta toxin family protein [Pseudomonadota bacterium]|nr:zeta toxin family protein [Pseudomonadota bacterium]
MDTTFLTTKSFQALEKSAFSAIQRIFPCENELLDHIPMEKIVSTFKLDKKNQKSPLLVRVSGQSGSGKSSQLVPAIQKALEQIPHLKINVGAFAPFHPQYDEFQKNDPDHMRENTNGFALRALVMFYKYCILNRINLIFDMTLLEPEVDLYLMTLAKKMGYRIHLHVLCVPRKVSDYFISHRQQLTGRFVKPSSSAYFFTALAPCLKALTHSRLFDTSDLLILWSHTKTHPIQITHLNNHSVLRKLNRFQERTNTRFKNHHLLFKAKGKWMKVIYRDILSSG